jgi:hypothetical protein
MCLQTYISVGTTPETTDTTTAETRKNIGCHCVSRSNGYDKDCSRRRRIGELGYESLTLAIRKQLPPVVPDGYWRQAEEHVATLKKEQQQQQQEPLELQEQSTRTIPSRSKE